MGEMINTVNAHIADQIESGGMEKQDKLFNLTKNAKDDAPITGFVEFLAFKIEERKYNIRYPGKKDKSKTDEVADFLNKDSVAPVRPAKAFD